MCAEHLKESAAVVTRGSRTTARETVGWGEGGLGVSMREATGDERIQRQVTGQTKYLRPVTGGMHSVCLPLADLHPDLLERGTE